MELISEHLLISRRRSDAFARRCESSAHSVWLCTGVGPNPPTTPGPSSFLGG